MLGILLPVVLGAVGALPVGAQIPSTDIWLADLDVSKGSVTVGRPHNVTRRTGYDNQPRFLPNGGGFLYVRGDSNGTDVYRYDLATGRSNRLTSTPESEYSPTPMGDLRGGFCAVRVEADSTQRLWRFESDGSNPRLVLAAVDSVGYFHWLDEHTLALFVVGDPHTLRVVDVPTQRETVVASDIGRALLASPRGGGLVFAARNPESDPAAYTFFTWRKGDRRATRLIAARGGGQDAAWVGESLIMADGSTLYRARPFANPEWTWSADLRAQGLSTITRLAVSPDHRRVAIVAAESP